jgi:hypothetical protein
MKSIRFFDKYDFKIADNLVDWKENESKISYANFL